MSEKCFICDTPLSKDGINLCKEHTIAALEVLYTGKYKDKNYNIIENPEFKHHCGICGEWENRTIINYPEWLFLCEKDIEVARKAYEL